MLAADQGERLRFSDADFLIRASAETTNGAFCLIEEIDPLDTPLHVHEHEDELFHVLEGEHVVQVGDEEFELAPGDLAYGPRGVPHAQRRVVPRTGRILIMSSRPASRASSASPATPTARTPTPGSRPSTASPGSRARSPR